MQTAALSDETVVESIRALLEKKFGRTSAKAIDFYADAHLATANPEEYAKTLLSIFGAGAEHLLAAIIAGLGDEFGMDVHEGTTLDELMDALMPKQGEK